MMDRLKRLMRLEGAVESPPADASQFPSGVSARRGADGEGVPASSSDFDWMDGIHPDPSVCLCRGWQRQTDSDHGRNGHHSKCRQGGG